MELVSDKVNVCRLFYLQYTLMISRKNILRRADGIDVGFLKLFLLLYADDIVIFSESATGLQNGLNILHDYCNKWKLSVNIDKSNVIIFRKGGRIGRDVF